MAAKKKKSIWILIFFFLFPQVVIHEQWSPLSGALLIHIYLCSAFLDEISMRSSLQRAAFFSNYVSKVHHMLTRETFPILFHPKVVQP